MQAIAKWNPARDVWEVPETDNLLCAHWDVFSETFPTSGMTVGGTAYELPTLAPRMDDSESSLLPTPTAHQDGSASNLEARQARVDAAKARHGRIFGKTLEVAIAMLPDSSPPPRAATPTDQERTGTAG